jgi:hypothetical protein
MSDKTLEASAAATDMAPEVRQAIEAVNLPEVQDLIRQLAKYNLAVCVPHMHTRQQGFAALPADTVQVEQNCQVRWERATTDANRLTPNAVAVGWRWVDDSTPPHMVCWKICVKNNDGTHYERCMN